MSELFGYAYITIIFLMAVTVLAAGYLAYSELLAG